MFLRALERLRTSGAAVNVTSSLVRAGGRGLWGLAVPALLSVESFAIYSLWQTTAAIVAQIGVLGTPQLVMRERKHSLPIGGLMLHTTALVIVGAAIARFVLAGQDTSFYVAVLAGSLGIAWTLILTARAKGSLQFGSVLVVESIGAGLLVGLGIPLLATTRGADSHSTAIMLEVATVVPAIAVLTSRRLRLSDAERRVNGTRASLGPIYSIGVLVLLDLLLWRRVEVYFLRTSPDGMKAIAVFSLAIQLSNLFMTVPAAVVEAWYPSMAAVYRDGREAFAAAWSARRRTYTTYYFVFVIGATAAFLLLVRTIFTKYAWALGPMSTIVLVRLTCGYAGLYSSMLYATARERWLYFPVIVGAAAAVLCNSIFTLSGGLAGLVIAYAITQFIVAALTLTTWKWSRRER